MSGTLPLFLCAHAPLVTISSYVIAKRSRCLHFFLEELYQYISHENHQNHIFCRIPTSFFLSRRAAASALAAVCFAEVAKEVAIANEAVPILSNLLVDNDWKVRAEAASALMVITTMDEGKKQIYPCGGVHKLMRMLDEDQEVLVLNVLKVLGMFVWTSI